MDRTDSKSGTPLTQRRSGPVRYKLVSNDGRSVATNASARYLSELAGRLWPDQEQDPDRTGWGWDIQIVPIEGVN